MDIQFLNLSESKLTCVLPLPAATEEKASRGRKKTQKKLFWGKKTISQERNKIFFSLICRRQGMELMET
jgi:hypothetical protein